MFSKRTKKIITKSIFLILIIWTTVYGVIFGLRFILQTDYPVAVVEGKSMEKTLFDGDLIIIQGTINKSNIEPDTNIIVFHNPADWNHLIVHRVIDRIKLNENIYFKTMGDNNQIPDQFYVPVKNIEGVVIWSVPGLGKIMLFTQSMYGRMTVVILVICNVIFVLSENE
jgi:signal peptidase